MGVQGALLSGVSKGRVGAPGSMHPDALRAALGREPKQGETSKKNVQQDTDTAACSRLADEAL
jgi:hypothetical protein